MNGVFRPEWGYNGQETTWANDMKIGINHSIGAGSIARPVDM